MRTGGNPTVNRCLRDKEMDLIDHALGRPMWPMRETYRNHFATDAESGRAIDFTFSLHWEKTAQSGDMAFFSVSMAGRKALAEHLKTLEEPWRAFEVSFDGFTTVVPAKSRSKAIYSYFLDVSDGWDDLTFGEFIRNARARALA